jgi:hypothetical protein
MRARPYPHIRSQVEAHPLRSGIVPALVRAWDKIADSHIAGIAIPDLAPSPQLIGTLLHEVLARELPGWRKGAQASEKDIETASAAYSFELKTSSSKTGIYGNRSYALGSGGKSRSGYLVAVNFIRFGKPEPGIALVRMGYLDASDWVAQTAASGQQARLTREAREHKLVEVFRR